MKSKNVFIILGVIVAIAVVVLLIVFTGDKNQDYSIGDGNTDVRSLDSYDESDLTIQQAAVNDVSINVMESFPVQVRVTASGELRNGCEEIYEVLSRRDGSTFFITLNAAAPSDAVCTQVVRPFEETFPLDVEGLSAGTYTVDVNGVTATFTLTADNIVNFEAGEEK